MRGAFKQFLAELVCVEIGVHAAENAVDMLTYLPLAKFYLVDSYDVNNTTLQPGGRVLSQEERELFVKEAKERVEPFNADNRIIWLIEDSVTAAEKFKDNSIDFVYIDAQHEYEAVIKDITAWYPKVKLGGMIGGHDYYDGVKQAVLEKFGNVQSGDGSDWWTRK